MKIDEHAQFQRLRLSSGTSQRLTKQRQPGASGRTHSRLPRFILVCRAFRTGPALGLFALAMCGPLPVYRYVLWALNDSFGGAKLERGGATSRPPRCLVACRSRARSVAHPLAIAAFSQAVDVGTTRSAPARSWSLTLVFRADSWARPAVAHPNDPPRQRPGCAWRHPGTQRWL